MSKSLLGRGHSPTQSPESAVGPGQAATTNCLCAAPYQVLVDGVQQDGGEGECGQVPSTGGGGIFEG
jgi:hypothetical protein